MDPNLLKTAGETFILDMDGFLCDFATASIKACGLPMQHDDVKTWNFFEPHMTEEEYIRCIDSIPGYWENLEPYEWTAPIRDAVNGLRSKGANILFFTNPGIFKGARRGKINWLMKHGFIDNERDAACRVVFGVQKWRMAKDDTILIDDSPIQVAMFSICDGHGVCFPQPWNWDSSEWPAGISGHNQDILSLGSVKAARLYVASGLVNSFNEAAKDYNCEHQAVQSQG